MNTYFIFWSLFILINVICVFSLIFIERRDPPTTWAWLLILILLPVVGFILYLCFGQNLSREKLFRKKTIIDEMKINNLKDRFKQYYINQKDIKQYVDLIKMNFNHCGSIYTVGNEVKTYVNGEDKFTDLLKDIENAKEFIHVEYYIFKYDGLGKILINALKKKVDEGVQVRLLVDGMGSRTLVMKQEKYIQSLGINFAVFFPGILPFINLRINFRNHRKIVVIDGKIGYVGGFNVGDEYINKGTQFPFWRDTHLRIKGNAVTDLNKRFIMDWDYAAKDNLADDIRYFPKSKDYGNVGIQIVSSGPDNNEEYIKNSYMKIINDAKKNVFIQTPYLVLDEPMIESLKISALSGVDVRIMVPDKPDHSFMEWALSSNIANLIQSGVKFYRYEKGFIHSKTIMADGVVSSVGTANLDIRSFSLNFEVIAIIYNESITKEHERVFLEDERHCTRITIEAFNGRCRYLKIMESVIRLVSPIL